MERKQQKEKSDMRKGRERKEAWGNVQEGKGRIDSQKSQLRISFLFSAALCVSISLFHHSFLPSHSFAFCFCWLSASPCFCLSLSLSLTPDSVECRSQCLGALLSLSLSVSLSLTIHSLHCFSPPSPPLGLWFLRAGRRLLDSSLGWIPLYWIWFLLHMERAESAKSQGPAASISWNGSRWFPSLYQQLHTGGDWT